jgi:hypothetical protein
MRHLGASLHGQNLLKNLVLLHELLFMSFCFMGKKLHDSIYSSFQFLMPNSRLPVRKYCEKDGRSDVIRNADDFHPNKIRIQRFQVSKHFYRYSMHMLNKKGNVSDSLLLITNLLRQGAGHTAPETV